MKKELFGKTKNDKNVYKYTINNNLIGAEIIDYGAAIYSLTVPDKKGNPTDVVLMPEALLDIEKNMNYMGATVGRYANRIKNGEFTLNGVLFKLSSNENLNSLHGGKCGFDKKIWKASELKNGIEFSYFSKDGEEGYPGNLNVTIRYMLEYTSIIIEYEAKTDKDTPLNLTNHSYFNLNGHNSGTIINHKLKLNSEFYLPIDETLIPTGEILKTENTKFDLCKERDLTEHYDHCFVLSDNSYLKHAGTLKGDISGIEMNVYTTKPGIQIYSGKAFSSDTIGKGGKIYEENSFVCMETEFFPDSPNKPHFPDTILKKNETYNHKTIYKFN